MPTTLGNRRPFSPAEFATLLDEAAARKDRSQAPSEYVALQQIGRERKLDLSHYFPRIRLEDSLKNIERRNDLVLGELARQSKGRLQRGLALAGGVAITLEIDERAAGPDDANLRKEKIKKAIEIIANRIDARGIAEPIIRPIGSNRIEVQLPDVNIRDNPDIVAQVEKPARLDFRLVHPTLRPGPGVNPPEGYEVLPLEADGRGSETAAEELFIKIVPEFSGNLVAEARADRCDRSLRSHHGSHAGRNGPLRRADEPDHGRGNPNRAPRHRAGRASFSPLRSSARKSGTGLRRFAAVGCA